MPPEQVQSVIHKAAPRDWNRRGHGNGNEVPMQTDRTKLCTGCGEHKAPEAFWRDRHIAGGRQTRCIVCSNLRIQERRRSGPLPRRPDYVIEAMGYKTPCWRWLKAINRGGYGVKSDGGRMFIAHRWSYLKHVGEIPDGLVIDHLCRNPACVNPAHLEPVTVQENTLRGLTRRLTRKQVDEIRAAKTTQARCSLANTA